MDYWKILGLNEGSSLEDIKKAYHALVKKYHPDHNPSADAPKKFREVQKAYEFLKDNLDYKSPDSKPEPESDETKDYESTQTNTTHETKTNSGSTYKRNYHERYNRSAYHKSSGSQNAGTHRTYNSRQNSSYRSSSSRSYASATYNNYSGSSYRSSYSYSSPNSSYMSHPTEKSVWEKIGIVFLVIIGIILGIPLFLFACIFIAIL